VVAVLILAGGGGFYWWNSSQSKAAPAAAQTTTAPVQRGRIELLVSTNGRVVSNLDVDIKCKASGTIIKLPFDLSDTVKEKDLLMELDPVDENNNKKRAEVNLASSKARQVQAKTNLQVAESTLATDLAKAQVNLEAAKTKANDGRAKAQRMTQLLEKKLISPEDNETAQTAAAQADSDVKTAQVRLQELDTAKDSLELKRQDVALADAQVTSDTLNLADADQRLKDIKVAAPIDGVVTALNVQSGTIIASGVSNVGGGTTIMTLSDLTHIFVVASVDEIDIGKVKLDQFARIDVDAFKGEQFRGKVTRIAPKGVNASNVVTFEVKMEIVSENKTLLRPEMTANIKIVAARKDDALTVPSDAVSHKDKQTVVTVLNGESQEDRPVEVGINNSQQVEVLSGLEEGQVVVVHKDADSKWRGGQQQQPGGPPPAMRMMPRGGGR
jgi:multidrug efflux pump subunit AcrA (membrane-fusion protein)